MTSNSLNSSPVCRVSPSSAWISCARWSWVAITTVTVGRPESGFTSMLLSASNRYRGKVQHGLPHRSRHPGCESFPPWRDAFSAAGQRIALDRSEQQPGHKHDHRQRGDERYESRAGTEPGIGTKQIGESLNYRLMHEIQAVRHRAQPGKQPPRDDRRDRVVCFEDHRQKQDEDTPEQHVTPLVAD